MLVTQSCPILCNPMDYSPPVSSVHGISQAGILERIAISLSRGSSRPRERTRVSCTAGGFFTIGVSREAQDWLGVPYIQWWVPLQETEEKTQTYKGEGDMKMEQILKWWGSKAKETKECWWPPELEEARKNFPLELLKRVWLCWHLAFWTSGLQICERMHLCYFWSLSFPCCFMAASEN